MRTRSEHPGLDRRRLLLGGLSMFGGAALGSVAGASPLVQRGSRHRRNLVLLQLSGGNDGLSTVIPYADDLYHAGRTTTRIQPREVLRLDEYRGLHPNLKNTHRLFREGRLAIIEGTGYPRPNRSHFKSLEIWHTGRGAGRDSGDGWVGRLCAEAFADEASPELTCHIGRDVPYSLRSSSHPPVSFATPNGYRWVGDDIHAEEAFREAATVSQADANRGVLGDLRQVLRDAQASSRRIRRAVADYRPTVEFPRSPLGASLRTVSAMIDASLGTRVYSVELPGFDTHSAQRRNHDRLMATLDQAVSAFLGDLSGKPGADETLVLVFSEFGRRVAENGSQGTDHGVAGPMLAFGHNVKGGLYGRHPSLEDLDEGDLIHTTDFRSVYATAIERWLGTDSMSVLGANYPLIDFV